MSDRHPDRTPSAVNWNPPSKHDAVQRALEDGLKDPAEIAAWAKERFQLHLTAEEIQQIQKALAREGGGEGGNR